MSRSLYSSKKFVHNSLIYKGQQSILFKKQKPSRTFFNNFNRTPTSRGQSQIDPGLQPKKQQKQFKSKTIKQTVQNSKRKVHTQRSVSNTSQIEKISLGLFDKQKTVKQFQQQLEKDKRELLAQEDQALKSQQKNKIKDGQLLEDIAKLQNGQIIKQKANQSPISLTNQSGYQRMWIQLLKKWKNPLQNEHSSSKNTDHPLNLIAPNISSPPNLSLSIKLQQSKNNQLISSILQSCEQKISQLQSTLHSIKTFTLHSLYIQSHQLHQKYIEIKGNQLVYQNQYQGFLLKLKQQEEEKKEMLKYKRKISTTNISVSGTRKIPTNTNNSNHIIRYFQADINLNDENIRQVMQKKSKLNLQLDLSFQVQQRKKIQKQKQLFQQQKDKLIKEKQLCQTKINQTKHKIQLKEQQLQKIQMQKQKNQRQREYFLKMMLKNTQYQPLGAVWTLKKMIQYGVSLNISDFSSNLHLQAKQFLMQEFEKMKKQNIFTLKPIKRKIKRNFNREVKPANRQRVKSMIFMGNQPSNNVGSYRNQMPDFDKRLSKDMTKKQSQGFFQFGSRNLAKPQQPTSIREKSGSVTLPKTYQLPAHTTQTSVIQNIPQSSNAFKAITLQKSTKKIYQSTKSYIKRWVNKQGWNFSTPRASSVLQKQNSLKEEKKIAEQFIAGEKYRIKDKFFKVGRANTKYKQILTTMYGEEDQVTYQTSGDRRRIKTSR